jgi:hypothetical protein
VSLTTHKGAYFLWIQRPRLTFFFVHTGTASPAAPPSVFLVFRTQSPQLPTTNHLDIGCDGRASQVPVTPTFWIAPGAFTTSRHYMYEVPLEHFAPLLACGTAAITVGGVTAPFAQDHLEALREFAAHFVTTPEEPSEPR